MKSKKIFSEVLVTLKTESGLTWKEVARAAGLSAPALSAYVHEKHYPHDENHAKIARGFALTTEQLKDLEGRKLAELVGRAREAAAGAAARPGEPTANDDAFQLVFSRPLPEARPEAIAEQKRLLSLINQAVDRCLRIVERWSCSS